ncbi:PH domain-containing protein [Streptomyces sp. NPDC005811]|uniref:PH domain-containing protein n=1 Tax=Streptomyces sp. NPDC005811 TaxID=3154565 RepID=UPI0033E7EC9B
MGEGIEREYRRRRAVPLVYLTLVAMTAVVGINTLDMVTLDGPTGWHLLTLAIWLGLGTRIALEQWRARTSVTAEGVTARGPLLTRTRAWSEIYGMRVEGGRRGAVPRWPAYLYDVEGRRIRLFQLDEQQVGDPVGEVADLSATAVRLGFLAPETRPELEALIARRARRRTAFGRAVVGCLIVALAAFVVSTWLIFTDRPTHTFLLLLGLPLLCLPVLFLALDRLGETLAARRAPGGV